MKRIYIEAEVSTVNGETILVWIDEPFKGANVKLHLIAMRTNIIRAGVPSVGGLLFPEADELTITPPSQLDSIHIKPCRVYEVEK
jgi:uncharacterized protein (DUF302 family)